MSSLPLLALVAIFLAAAGAVWLAGVRLSNSTDVLSSRLGLGQALGGLILLAIATNLPELAITASAAVSKNFGIAIGNILGGIAIQTVVLALLDAVGVRGKHPLTYRAASLALVLEGALVIAVLIVAIMGSRLPASLVAGGLAPGGVLIAILWIAGLFLLGRARTDLPWQEKGRPPDGQDEPHAHSRAKKDSDAQAKGHGTARTALVFAAAAAVTLVAGIVLERSGEEISGKIGVSGVLFGSTILAAATALPEVSTGLTSVKLGDFQLAVSDIFGGNAFLPVLFLMASLISGQAVLPSAQDTDVYMAGLGVLLTAVYIYGLIFRPRRRIARMGVDSLVVVVLYVVGIVGLVVISGSGGG